MHLPTRPFRALLVATTLTTLAVSATPTPAHAWGEKPASYSCSGYWISSDSPQTWTKFARTQRTSGTCGGHLGAWIRFSDSTPPIGGFSDRNGKTMTATVSYTTMNMVGGIHRPCTTCVAWWT